MKLLLLCALAAVAAASSVSHVTVQRREGLQSPYGPSGYDQFSYGVQHGPSYGYGGPGGYSGGGYGVGPGLSGLQYNFPLGYGQSVLGLHIQDPYTGSAAWIRKQGNVLPNFRH